MAWGRLRLGAFSLVGAALLLVGAFVRWAGVDRAGIPALETFGLLGALMATIVALDVVYHALRGEGQACRSCGHLRPMKPFRFYGACPNCGAE